MMGGQPIILGCERTWAHRVVDAAPVGSLMVIKPARRTLPQNALCWALLGDVSRAKPLGKSHTPETWKCLFMHALGHQSRFEMGLNGEPFPVGFRSSHLSKEQMADLITFIIQWGDEHGVRWTKELVA